MQIADINLDIYLETGQKRVFAGALDWPGWCRSGRDQASALQALFEYGPRYARIFQGTQLNFQPPANPSAFTVVERLPGDATTDFGAPAAVPSVDALPVSEAELHHFQLLLQAFWHAFDAAMLAVAGKDLRKGPRGGGRGAQAILQHVIDSDGAYLSSLGWKVKYSETWDAAERLEHTRQAILDGLASAARGEIEPRGPRGGLRWPPRYFVRRLAWHVLDHTWEIEDRMF
jgi:hypothetical protein